ncbi:L-serine ammonia-lyase, iron-sulfur-dependent, subunit alpha [Intestinibacter sp.]|uniref:L-serine ammonia-lyase, iron-sulfur-dependent, subunit alpha n=1 Tax=Intestinibacter sp. TaxID=1965304 RepID=UPI003F1590EA
MESLKELYKMGPGPSSSHTMGPQRAAKIFNSKNPDAASFRVHLYGSLAATGKGHLTDFIIIKTLAPKEVEVVWEPEIVKEFHTNGMKFEALDADKNITDEWTVFSIGGGSLAEEGKRGQSSESVYPHDNLEDIIEWCRTNHKNFVDYVKEYDDDDIMDYLRDIRLTMRQSLEDGLKATEVIPGKLKLARKARNFYRQYKVSKQLTSMLYAYALAVSEQNASGFEIVTAPTCGSAGVLPAVLFTLQDFYGFDDEAIEEGLAVAGLMGVVVKQNASVSGAEVGCQGEVGVACAMAAAAAAFIKGGPLRKIEYAAEIGLEHHLGMTCDPAYGYVQIPCIERNAMGAQRALDAANYALLSDGIHHIKFDQIVKIMDETGRDMMEKYKETAKGGIALLYEESGEFDD